MIYTSELISIMDAYLMDAAALQTHINKNTYKNLRIGFIWASKISLIILVLITVTLWIDYFDKQHVEIISTTALISIQIVFYAMSWGFFHFKEKTDNYKIIASIYAFLFGANWGGIILTIGNIAHAYLIAEVMANLILMVALLGFYTYRTAAYLAILPILLFSTWVSISDPNFGLLFSLEKLIVTWIIIESGRHILVKWFTQRLNQEYENKRLLKKLAQMASKDQLTKINNRRFFDFAIDEQIHYAQDHQRTFSIILIDIDYFKNFNDALGHIEGDKCLQLVAKVIDASLFRGADTVSRYGGEEFVILLPNTAQSGAINVAKRLKYNLEKVAIPHPNSKTNCYVTVSQGIASWDHGQLSSDILEVADKNLYLAKKQGRNQFCISE